MSDKYNFQWEWCYTCDCWFIRCPKCGNNSCNGGYGNIDGEECDICSLAYSYQKLANETGHLPDEPSNDQEKKKIYLIA